MQDKKIYKIAAICVFLFVGLRAPVVGADTWVYYRYYLGENAISEDLEIEPAFLLYNSIFQILFFKIGQLFILANTFLSFIMIYKLIDKFSFKRTMSVLLFFFLVSYQNYFVALRQILGISALLYGVWYVVNNKKKKWIVYILMTIVGWQFHTSVIIASVIYLIVYYLNIKRTTAILCVLLSAIGGVIMKQLDITLILNLLFANFAGIERLQSYSDNVDYWFSDEANTLFILRFSIIAIFVLLFIPKERVSHWFTKIYIVGVCLHSLFCDFGLIGRLSLPFELFGIIVFTWMYFPKNLTPSIKRSFVCVVSFIMISYLSLSFVLWQKGYDITSKDRMHPYYFFFQDYNNHPSRYI